MSTAIVIVDDHKLFREGLKSLLLKQHDVDVLGEAADGRAAVRLISDTQPQLVLMDVAMPELNGIEATRQALAAAPGVRVLPLSMHADSRFVTQMLQAGAAGYMLKDCAFDELAVAIESVMSGQVYLSPGVTGVVVKDYVRRLSNNQPHVENHGLTPREREVLQLLAEGKATKEIASVLEVSIKTAESHRKQIMDKLELRSVAELTKYAVREGLTGL